MRLPCETLRTLYSIMTARHIELVYEMSTVQMQFNSSAYVAHSAKSSLQTLMKNQ